MADGGLWHPDLTRWVDDVDRYWASWSVPGSRREQLRRDLVTDLAQARACGATVEKLVSTPPEQFATDVAMAEAIKVVPLPELKPKRLRGARWAPFIAGIEGLVAGALASAFVIYPLGIWFEDAHLASHPDPWGFTLVVHVVAASVTLGFVGLAIRLALGRSPRAGRQTLHSVVALAVGGVIALIAAVSFASTTDFSTRPTVVAVEVAIVVVCCLGGLAASVTCVGRRYRPESWLDVQSRG